MGISNSYLYDSLPYIFAISDLMMFNVFSSTFFWVMSFVSGIFLNKALQRTYPVLVLLVSIIFKLIQMTSIFSMIPITLWTLLPTYACI